MLKRDKEAKVCVGRSKDARHHIDREIFFYRCIGNFFSYGAVHLIELYNRFEKGILPYDGCLSDQPNKVMEAFRIIDNYKTQRIMEEHQRQKQQSRLKGNGRK